MEDPTWLLLSESVFVGGRAMGQRNEKSQSHVARHKARLLVRVPLGTLNMKNINCLPQNTKRDFKLC